jgi:pimeloyl-ACP methyl ester carboxylesterase
MAETAATNATTLPRPDGPLRLDEYGEAVFPGARRPDREYRLEAGGLELALHEWGDPDAPPLLLAHGGFDFGRTYDGFAPLLAAAGWRAVAWDQRGHGDSDHVELYAWEADMRDALAVFDHVSPDRALPVIGHSKGGALMSQLADAQPFRFSHLVNLDGVPYRRNVPDVAEHERTKMAASELDAWLAHRRRTANAQRKPGTIDELASRRGRMNPRLPFDWLRRLVTVGGFESVDGWRWKIDPSMRFGGFGPWRPEWTLIRLPGLPMPFLGVLAGQLEEMGWGTPPDKVVPYAPANGRFVVMDDVGHFVHIERPGEVAEMVLDFVGAPR